MSEMISNISSEINQTDMKLSSIKQDLSQMKQSMGINNLHKGSITAIVDTPANIEVSGGEEYGAPFVKILYLTDLAQKMLSLHIFSYLCAYLAISARV